MKNALWPRSVRPLWTLQSEHLAKNGNLAAVRPRETIQRFQLPLSGRDLSQLVSTPGWYLLNTFESCARYAPSMLNNNSAVLRTCSTRWLMPLDFEAILAKYSVFEFRCRKSQNSNFDCPPPNNTSAESKYKKPGPLPQRLLYSGSVSTLLP